MRALTLIFIIFTLVLFSYVLDMVFDLSRGVERILSAALGLRGGSPFSLELGVGLFATLVSVIVAGIVVYTTILYGSAIRKEEEEED